MPSPFRRAIVIVMDSVGVGELPDAATYGDQGSDTIGNIAKRVPLALRIHACKSVVPAGNVVPELIGLGAERNKKLPLLSWTSGRKK